MTQIDCPHCDATNAIPEDEYFDGFCGSCDNDMTQLPEEDANTPGDIGEAAPGLFLETPHGTWFLPVDEALKVATGLTTMAHHHLTRPWAAEDDSTVLSRGNPEFHNPAEKTAEPTTEGN